MYDTALLKYYFYLHFATIDIFVKLQSDGSIDKLFNS